MKKLYSYILLLLITPISGFSQTSPWTVLNSGTTNSLIGLSAPSATVCYVGGNGGTLLKTTNGGLNWTPLTSGTTSNFASIYFIDLLTGYAVGDNGLALKTSNGGTSWTQMSVGTSASFRCVLFLDSNTGYITSGSSGVVLKTANGGTSWTSVTAPTVGLYGMDFSSTSNGYAVDFGGLVAKTTDGGNTWTSSNTGTAGILADVDFIDSTTGFVVGRNGVIKKTIDAGATWTDVAGGTTDAMSGIVFLDSNNGFIVGGNITNNTGVILSTSNGGDNWSIYNPTTPILYKVRFVNPNVGYCVGNNGTILKYTAALNISVSTTDVTTSCNGNVTAMVSGGTPPYSFSWSNGASSTSTYVDSLCSGIYNVIVIDGNGLMDTAYFTINPPSANLAVSIASINCSAFGMCDGAVNASAVGGFGPYSFSWNDGHTTSSISGLCTGLYTVVVADSAGLTGYGSVFISQPSDTTNIDSTLAISTSVTNLSVFGSCDGQAIATATGGLPPYFYSWSTGDTTSTITGLCSNVYFVTATDHNGQTVSTSAYVSEPIITYTDTISMTPTDTIYSSPIDTCIVDSNFPIDSASITSFSIIDANNILVNWAIWQNGVSATISVSYEYSTFGTTYLVLTLNCSGELRTLQTSIIGDVININNSTTGINNQLSDNSMKVYPNPASDNLNIELQPLKNTAFIQIKNVLGQIVFNETVYPSLNGSVKHFNLENYSKGIYFIQLISNNIIVNNKKFIIE